MKYSHTIYYIFLFLNLCTLLSCTPQSCQEETETLAGVSFYKTGTGKMEAPDSVTVYTTTNPVQFIYNNAPKINFLFLPLNPSTQETSFILRINGINDTVTFINTSFPHLISKECGYVFFYEINEYEFTKSIIDTIIVTNKRITTSNEENIRIFY